MSSLIFIIKNLKINDKEGHGKVFKTSAGSGILVQQDEIGVGIKALKVY